MIRNLRRFILRHFVNVKVILICGILMVGIFYFLNFQAMQGKRQVWDISHSNITGDKCIVDCPRSQYSFYVKSGDGLKSGPIICFNNEELISPRLKNTHRGINAVFIDVRTKKVSSVTYFDTYVEDFALIRYLKRDVPDEAIVLMASFDEMSSSLKADGRKWLKSFGSNLIDKVGFRDAFVLIGQRGLKPGHAIEFNRKNKKDFAPVIEKSGCFSMPMGPLAPVQMMITEILVGNKIKYGERIEFCGMKSACTNDTFPAHLFTGKDNVEYPQICVDELLIMAKGLNHAGRGMNIVTYNPDTKKVQHVSTFDTYKEDSTDLEMFLESLPARIIIMVAVWDDAAIKLSNHARVLFNSLGSSMIQNLKFRDVWYFVGQKGIEGFSTFEQISYAKPDSGWPNALQLSACIPYRMKGTKVRPDPMVYRNDARREFCLKYEGYVEFCDYGHIDDMIKPVSLVDNTFRGHKIFTTPIIIIPGVDHNAVVNTFQTTIMQSGLNPKMVLVCWDEKFPEFAELAELFGFQNRSLLSSTRYTEVMMKAIDMAWKVFPQQEHIIFIEEELLLSPDFLFYMAQSLPALEVDPSLLAISAWNYNGYENTSENRSLLYRVEDFPGLGFMLKKDIYLNHMKDRLKECCSRRIWDGWSIKNLADAEVIVPDVSRVYRQPFLNSASNEDYLKILFHKPRMTNLEQHVKLSAVKDLKKDTYESSLQSLLKNSVPLDISYFKDCLKNSPTFLHIQYPQKKGNYVVYYEQSNIKDFDVLGNISKCFGFFTHMDYKPKGLHKGLLRFTHHGNLIFLIGAQSSYYELKPQNHEALTKKSTLLVAG